MTAAVLVGLAGGAEARDFIVAELPAKKSVVIDYEGRREVVRVDAATGGKLGWSFDLGPSCQIALIVPIEDSKTDDTELLVGALGQEDWRRHLRRVFPKSSGLSSPALGPDGMSLAVVDNDEVWVVDLPSGKPRRVGKGQFGVWEEGGSLLVYLRKGECHELSRFAGGTLTRIDQVCGGEIALPVASGTVPKGMPLPLIDDRGNLVGMLGGKVVPGLIGFGSEPRGRGCEIGATFTGKLRGPLSLSKVDGNWKFDQVVLCPTPTVTTPDGTSSDLALKALKCRALERTGAQIIPKEAR